MLKITYINLQTCKTLFDHQKDNENDKNHSIIVNIEPIELKC